jgi:hypothetical protein
MRLQCGLLLALGLLWIGADRAVAKQPAEPRLLFDFESAPLASQWTAVGQVQAAIVPPAPGDNASADPNFRTLKITTTGAGGVYTLPDQVPADWRSTRAIAFRIFLPPRGEGQPAPRTTIEVQLLEADGRARFWRRIDLDEAGWHTLELPLAEFRWGEGRVPCWDRVARLGFWFRQAVECQLDDIRLVDGAPGAANLSTQQLQQIAFPDAAADQVRTARRNHLVVMSDAAQLDAEQLAEHLTKVERAVAELLPFLPPPRDNLYLLVFAQREAYQAFTPRFARTLNADARPPASSGYTMQGISSSYYSPELGTLRPVYSHEFVHAYAGQVASLVNKGEWFHEGLASWIQLQFHPQDNIAEIVRQGIATPANHEPLEQLCRGEPIGMSAYWQAMTLVEMLATDEHYRPRLPALIEAFQTSGNTTLGPHLGLVLARDWDTFHADWLAFCQQRYAP